jgi:hypothetical protein
MHFVHLLACTVYAQESQVHELRAAIAQQNEEAKSARVEMGGKDQAISQVNKKEGM